MSVRTVSERRFNICRLWTLIFHALSFLLAVTIGTVAATEYFRYEEYYDVIDDPSKGAGKAVTYMMLCAFFCVLCPISFTISFVAFPLVSVFCNRRARAKELVRKQQQQQLQQGQQQTTTQQVEEFSMSHREASIKDDSCVGSAAAANPFTPEAASLHMSNGNEGEDPGVAPRALTAWEEGSGGVAFDSSPIWPRHNSNEFNAMIMQDEINMYYMHQGILRVLQIGYFGLTFSCILLTFFLGLFGALSTAFANLNTTTTVAEGWDMYFQRSSVTTESNAKLCNLELRGKCSGGTNLCNQSHFEDANQAFAACCPYCPENQQKIATFTRSCAVRYTVGSAYPITYFFLSGLSAALLLVNFCFSAFNVKHCIFPCFSRYENLVLSYSVAQQHRVEVRSASLTGNITGPVTYRQNNADHIRESDAGIMKSSSHKSLLHSSRTDADRVNERAGAATTSAARFPRGGDGRDHTS